MENPDSSIDGARETPDGELIARAASGEADAFGELWRRHYAAGIRAARAITSSIEAEDLVQEAFTRIYRSLRAGRGPKQTFRSYLYAVIRNTAATWGKRRSLEIPNDTFEHLADPESSDAVLDEQIDGAYALAAFRTLPERWQEVLWYLDVEGLKPAAAAEYLGTSAHAASQLAVRARSGLRDAWISAQILRTEEGTECHWVADRLGRYMRDTSSARESSRVDHHLAGCENCRKAAGEARQVASRLQVVVLPLVLGTSGAAAFLASAVQGAAPAAATPASLGVQAAVPEMPHAVVASSAAGRIAAVAGWKWAAVVAVGVAITGAFLLAPRPEAARTEAEPQRTVTSSPMPERVDPQTPSVRPEAQEAPPVPAAEPEPELEPESEPEPTPTDSPEPRSDPEPDPEPTSLPAPEVWNTSRTAQADGSYAITIMLGGQEGVAAVAILDGTEIARAEGAAPQLSFSLTAEQYASGALSFALFDDPRLGVRTETRTPSEWCEPRA